MLLIDLNESIEFLRDQQESEELRLLHVMVEELRIGIAEFENELKLLNCIKVLLGCSE